MSHIIDTNNQQGGDRRRDAQEHGYESLIRKMAQEIVNPSTTKMRRERCQVSLQQACMAYGKRHGVEVARLYWLAIEYACRQDEDGKP